MANYLMGGFWPCNEDDAQFNRYEVANNNSTAIFAGDVVTLTTAGVVQPCTAGDTALILGVVKQVSYVLSGKRIVSTYLPANTTYTPTTRGSRTASYVWVYDDPGVQYWACLAANSGTDTEAKVWAAVGSNMDIVATAGDTVYRRSGHTLDGNPIAGTAQFRINGVRRIPGRDMTSTTNLQVRCSVNEGIHAYFSGAGI